MDLSLYERQVFSHYNSNSQIARVLTEKWAASQLYCPCCLNPKIDKFPANQKARDFFCEKCKNDFQLKSASRPFGNKVVDGDFKTMTRFVLDDVSPNFLLMQYSNDEWVVKNLFMIPKFFVNTSMIEKRNPLTDKARRRGWTGCNILLGRIPEDGKIGMIRNEKEIPHRDVNKKWKRMLFLNRHKPTFRGWTADVLKCVEDLSKPEFTLSDVYSFKQYLKELHPDNRNIDAKIRQQLQILRDNGILSFVSKGNYKIIC